MNTFLFNEFIGTSSAAWKQKIQADLKGADYNETLLWKTNEGITVKPFYSKEDRTNTKLDLPKKGFNICQTIFIDNEKIANSLALDALRRGATSIQFISKKPFNCSLLLQNIDINTILIYFRFQFLPSVFLVELSKSINPNKTFIQLDIIGNLAENGNWFINLNEDFRQLDLILKSNKNCVSVSSDLYQNAGATIVQELAYTLAHANEYLNYFGKDIADKIHFTFSAGSNYFFEIAKLRAFRILWRTLLNEYGQENRGGFLPGYGVTQRESFLTRQLTINFIETDQDICHDFFTPWLIAIGIDGLINQQLKCNITLKQYNNQGKLRKGFIFDKAFPTNVEGGGTLSYADSEFIVKTVTFGCKNYRQL